MIDRSQGNLLLVSYPNGGWVIQGRDGSGDDEFKRPRNIGAYSDATAMLVALKVLISERNEEISRKSDDG